MYCYKHKINRRLNDLLSFVICVIITHPRGLSNNYNNVMHKILYKFSNSNSSTKLSSFQQRMDIRDTKLRKKGFLIRNESFTPPVHDT